MTPETIRRVSQIRQEFYSLFAAAMQVPVIITGNSYTSNFPTASWLDERQKLNYVSIYAYTAPDEFFLERPFLIRIAINKGAGKVTVPKWGKECRGQNQNWHFELTALPEEILDFLPWIVSLIKAHEKNSPALLQEPPHSFNIKESNILSCDRVWTQGAERLAHAATIE